METKHYKLKHGWEVSLKDKRALEQWRSGRVPAEWAMFDIRENNDNPEMFETVEDFVQWANSLGYRKNNVNGER